VPPQPPAKKAVEKKDFSQQTASVEEKAVADEVTEKKAKIAELVAQKAAAIAAGYFLEAQRIKVEIKTLKSQGNVAELEAQRKLALFSEDFIEAHRIDVEIKALKLQAFEKVAEAEVVKVAGLDFNTHIWVITKELYNFGRDCFGFLFGYGEHRYWPGGWVMKCPGEGEKKVPRHWVPQTEDYIFVGRIVESADMAPSKWWLTRGTGHEPGLMYEPKVNLHQKDVRAIRRSTVNSRYLCLWTGREDQEEQEVVILRYEEEHEDKRRTRGSRYREEGERVVAAAAAPQQSCWSHEISIEANGRIADLCK